MDVSSSHSAGLNGDAIAIKEDIRRIQEEIEKHNNKFNDIHWNAA